jgi:cytochrome d ubiquinol oxidase subunit II
MILLFAYLAAVYLAGETSDDRSNAIFIRYSKRLLISLVTFGLVVFVAAELEGLELFRQYRSSWISVASAILATLLLPAFLLSLNKGLKNMTRLIAGAQTGLILIGWFGIQFPVLVSLNNTDSLTVYNTVAPDKTLLMMIIALFVGLALVIPLLVYLFKVFKFSTE